MADIQEFIKDEETKEVENKIEEIESIPKNVSGHKITKKAKTCIQVAN